MCKICKKKNISLIFN
ncbi:hypothetical protein [Plasmodium yoelii yoelii]|uniref:Uncharacterized protein n=1 Tax=Plasmodium yoelii yoelii TaxID=73239 RepID=Q7RPN3_PLAYO|nr:hypothetical protein [Plasmodium yoelii yoelii]